MTRAKILFSFFIFLLAGMSAARAADTFTAGPINTAAEVPSELALQLTIVDQLTGSPVPSMDFGELTRVNDEYRSARFFNILLKVNTAGSAYELTQLSTPLTRVGGSEMIPAGAFLVKPLYDPADNTGGAMPAGANLGASGTAVTPRAIFKDPSGSSRTLRLRYTLTGDPVTGATETIPLDQKSGAYAATVQFTLTTT